jgi:hypothetical protein
MKLVITYKDAEDKIHEDHLVSALDTAYLVDYQGQEIQPNESQFLHYLQKFYEDHGCRQIDIIRES